MPAFPRFPINVRFSEYFRQHIPEVVKAKIRNYSLDELDLFWIPQYADNFEQGFAGPVFFAAISARPAIYRPQYWAAFREQGWQDASDIPRRESVFNSPLYVSLFASSAGVAANQLQVDRMTSVGFSLHGGQDATGGHPATYGTIPAIVASGNRPSISHPLPHEGAWFWTLVVHKTQRRAAATLHWFLTSAQLGALNRIINTAVLPLSLRQLHGRIVGEALFSAEMKQTLTDLIQ